MIYRSGAVLSFSLLILVGGCSSSKEGSAGSGGSGTSSGGVTVGSGGVIGSGGVTGSGGSTSASGGAGGSAATGTLNGTINVKLVSGNAATSSDAYSTLSALIYPSPFPASPITTSDDMNGCQLWVPQSVTCSPGCATGSICTGNNQCTAKPAGKDVGEFQVTGLKTSDGATTFTVDAGVGSNFYMSATLPYPPCDEGATIAVQTDAFSVSGKCIVPLALKGPDPIPLVDADKKPVDGAVSWTAPGQTGISRIQILVEISHHGGGGSKGQIYCDVPDTGSFTIPQKLVADLIALGTAGYPTVVVTRVATASASADPNVQLVVSSAVERSVDTGVISCGGGDSDTVPVVCPTGQACASPPYICQ